MKSYSRLCALIFGITMTLLCIVITVETLLRKVFNHSLAGVDELSGYAIAIGAPLCFAVAAIEQSHIRINLFYIRLPRILKITLNAVSAILLTVLAIYLAIFTYRTVAETSLFGSIAQTPWMTPLIWPQSIWLIGMLIFTGATVFLSFRLVYLLISRKFDRVLSEYGPDAIEDELAIELSDLESRK